MNGESIPLHADASRGDNPVVNMLSVPGLLMQRMTTKEPDDEMIEVGIASVEAVLFLCSGCCRLSYLAVAQILAVYKATVRKFEVACIGLGCHCHLVVHAVQLDRFCAEYGFLMWLIPCSSVHPC